MTDTAGKLPELAAVFKAAHDEHAAAKIPKIYARGQREQANIIVGLRAVIAALAGQADAGRQEAVAWHTEDHRSDRSATTYDKVVAGRWVAKGWPVTPMFYSAPIPVDALRELVKKWRDRVEHLSRNRAPAFLDVNQCAEELLALIAATKEAGNG